MKTACMPCSPVPIYMRLQWLSESFPQSDIGDSLPFFQEKGQINQENNDHLGAKLPLSGAKASKFRATTE
jgi:hypothetical protein